MPVAQAVVMDEGAPLSAAAAAVVLPVQPAPAAEHAPIATVVSALELPPGANEEVARQA